MFFYIYIYIQLKTRQSQNETSLFYGGRTARIDFGFKKNGAIGTTSIKKARLFLALSCFKLYIFCLFFYKLLMSFLAHVFFYKRKHDKVQQPTQKGTRYELQAEGLWARTSRLGARTARTARTDWFFCFYIFLLFSQILKTIKEKGKN